MRRAQKSFFGQDIQKLGAMAAAGDVDSGKGSVRQQSVLDAYVDRVVQGYDEMIGTAVRKLAEG